MNANILIAILVVIILALVAFVVYKIKNPPVNCGALPPATRRNCEIAYQGFSFV